MAKRYEPIKSSADLQVNDTVTFWLHGETVSGVIARKHQHINLYQVVVTSGMLEGGDIWVNQNALTNVPKRIIETYQDFEAGDKVYINPLSVYCGRSARNPSCEVSGFVTAVHPHYVRVSWENGYDNSYGSEADGYHTDPEQGLHLCLCEEGISVQLQQTAVELECKTLSIKGDMLFGSDLELFVRDTRTNKIIPAGCLIPGTKSSPHKLTNGVCHPDGLAVEVACPPASTFKQLKANLDAVLKEVKDKFFPEEWYVFDDRCVVQAQDVQDIEKHKRDNPEWFISGCAPELDASSLPQAHDRATYDWYYYDILPKVKLRSKDVYCAGFHLHLGFTEWENTAVNRLDAGFLVRKIRKNHDLINTERNKYYGGANVFRMKPYGLEDRTYGADVFMKHIDKLEQVAYEYKKHIMEALNAQSSRV